MKIGYISNIPKNTSSGGGSGVNTAVYKYLQERTTYFNYQFINPTSNKIEKHKSRFQKLIGAPRNYFFFSEKRLKIIKEEFNFDENADFYFFHGFTPWIKTKPDKPYFCFNDACFATYVEIYNAETHFSTKDLNRIFEQEKEWLKKAKAVFFRSNWALIETKKKYNVRGDNFFNVGVGGFIDIPNEDVYSEGNNFLFIAREFIPKGGIEAIKALQIVKKLYPDVSLSILGDQPQDNYINLPGVNYIGFLDKDNSEEYKKMIDIFSNAFALVHPTIKDTNTLVINELAYFGCPAISSNRFAIPEYLINNKTGFLVNDPRNVDEIASKMLQLLNNKGEYNEMRKQARLNAINNNTWDNVLNRIVRVINDNV